MSATGMQDIELLHKEKKTWSQIRDLKYPGRSESSVRKRFSKLEPKLGEQDNESASIEDKKDDSVVEEKDVNV